MSRYCDVNESDSDSSREPRRHSYNTRSSGKNNLTEPQVLSRRKRQRPANNVNPSSSRRPDPEMDLCNGVIPPPAPRPAPTRNRRGCCSYFCTFLKIVFWLLMLGATCYSQWVLFKMDARLNKLEKDKETVFSPSRGVDPQAKMFKEINKKYTDVFKQLLQDPVGRPDFALESSGGCIISTDALPYDTGKKFFGLWACEGSTHAAAAIIRPSTAPGECWAFQGQKGSAVIQLIGFVHIDAVTLEHIPSRLSPTGRIDSAPKKFRLWVNRGANCEPVTLAVFQGLADSKRTGRKALLGDFEYDKGGPSLQTFTVFNSTAFYQYVEFEVLSNHGNKDYTCVYRLRVHGELGVN